ncbi:MAG: hypothetical protein PHD61_06755 [Bacteroidales bacterium]|nr:hypothetical protein [Lentimicrobiaceae bacterium]MDD5694988.1 hypothetical protein [Bacteroidales bacterium]
MKKVLILICIASSCLLATAQNGTIYAEVKEDTVTLWQTGAERNCAALYEMIVSLDDFHLRWLERDTGDMVFCMCSFDLSVTVASLAPGTYLADVYHTEIAGPDTIWDGSTTFVIEGPEFRDPVNMIAAFQSECYGAEGSGEIRNDKAARLGQNYPNPFSDVTFIPCFCPERDDCTLYVFDVFGHLVMTLNLPAHGNLLRWEGSDLNGNPLPAGMYYYDLIEMPGNDSRRMILIR